jgi:hypothetical protein
MLSSLASSSGDKRGRMLDMVDGRRKRGKPGRSDRGKRL